MKTINPLSDLFHWNLLLIDRISYHYLLTLFCSCPQISYNYTSSDNFKLVTYTFCQRISRQQGHMLSGDSLMHHSKQRVRWPAHCAGPSFHHCHRVSCLPARLPRGQAARPTLTALTGMLLKWHFTNRQPQIIELWAQLQVSAVRMETMTMISDTGRQQMFLSLTVADLTSHSQLVQLSWASRLQLWEEGGGELTFSIFWGWHRGWGPGKDSFRGL